MHETWVVDLLHYLDNGHLPSSLPRPARALAERLGAIVAAITSVSPDDPLGVECRRRPSRQRCKGQIEGFIEPDTNAIRWECLSCGDSGWISNWEDTIWDCRDAEDATRH